MSTVPAATAVTIPFEELTVAMEVLLLIHDPPLSPFVVYCAVAPMQRGELPLTTPAVAFGVIVNICDAVKGVPLHAFTV